MWFYDDQYLHFMIEVKCTRKDKNGTEFVGFKIQRFESVR